MDRLKIIPLALLSPGKKARVISIMAGRGLQERLTGIGIGLGSEVEVIYQGGRGPFLVAVKETRLAIGRGMAYKIMVALDSKE